MSERCSRVPEDDGENGWFRTLRRDNVTLITQPIVRVTADGIETASGSVELDVIILATGYQADRVMLGIEIHGRNDAKVSARLDGEPEAYLGMAVEDCPNFFVIPGPNGIPGHGGSAVFYAECQVHYITEMLRHALEHDHRVFEVRPQAVRDFVEETIELHNNLVWANSSVTDWCQGTRDRVTAISPRRIVELWETTRAVDVDAYACS